MKTTHPSNRNPVFSKPKNAAKAIEYRANSIRKLLSDKKSTGQGTWRKADDAIRLAAYIEQIAALASSLEAAEAKTTCEALELLAEELEREVCCLLASKAGVE